MRSPLGTLREPQWRAFLASATDASEPKLATVARTRARRESDLMRNSTYFVTAISALREGLNRAHCQGPTFATRRS